MPNAIGENHAERKLAAGELVLCMGVNARMRQAYETTARAAGAHGKWMGVGGVREDLEFQTWLLQLGIRYLTGGSDVGYILSAGRADVRRLREVRLS
jgi:2-keto-3-deoxy-L-rhamnonate aldolase RhmA